MMAMSSSPRRSTRVLRAGALGEAAPTPVAPPVQALQPAQLLRSRFALPPEALWQQLQHSRFMAEYLGASLPAAVLEPGLVLDGRDAQGRPLHLHVSDLQPPCSLSLWVRGAEGEHLLQMSLEACNGGSRLTVVHEPLAPASALQGGAAADDIIGLLATPPAAALMAARIGSPAALDLARAYLADSARAMELLLRAMGPKQGYAKPTADRFSLVEQIWHLADVEEFGWARRLPRVLAEVRPELPGVDGDRLALERRYQQRPWRAAARRFIAQRRRSLAALDRFDSATLERPLVFSGAPGDAGSLLAAMLAHDHEHRIEMAGLWALERSA